MAIIALAFLCTSLVVALVLARSPKLERLLQTGIRARGVVGWAGRGVPVESRGERVFRLPLTVSLQTEQETRSVDVVVLVDELGLSALVRNATFEAIVDRRDLTRMVVTRVTVGHDTAVTIQAPALQLT